MGCERTAIRLRYRSSFLAISWASSLRVTGSRLLVQFSVRIFRLVVNTGYHNRGGVLPDTNSRCLGSRGTWGGFSSATLVGDYREKPTDNRHEMPPGPPCNIGSSRPSRPVKFLRSASTRFIPTRPFVLNEIDSNGLKPCWWRPLL